MKTLPQASDFNVGDIVRGRDVEYRPFEGPVESRVGAYSVMVGGVFTPTSLIDEVVSRIVPSVEPTGGVFD